RVSLFVSRLLPWLVLIMSLAATFQFWKETQRDTDRILQSEFDFLTQDTMSRLQLRMQTYEQVLRGVVGLFAGSGSGDVTRDEFHAYYEALQLGKNYPGIQGVGFTIAIQPEQRDAHVAEIRGQGFPNYNLYPAGERDLYTSIIYLEPFYGRNLRAFGYDMFSESTRRAAMERARDTGESAITGKVNRGRGVGQGGHAGFLVCLPVCRCV